MTSEFPKNRRVALVTGASRGLGSAIAEELVRAGNIVAGIARDKRMLQSQEEKIGRDHFRAYPADLTDPHQFKDALNAIRSELGDPLILVNNAGYGGPYGFLHDTSDGQWSTVMAINVTIPFMLTRALVGAMGEARFGRIVNISSIYGITGGVGSAAYISAKHALVGLTKATAAEYGAIGITCNAVCPGYCATEMTQSLHGNPGLLARIPAGRLGEPAEVAQFVGWLASAENRYVNGAVLPIDGGLTADVAAVASPRASFPKRSTSV